MAEVVDTSSDVVSSLPNVPAGDYAAAWVYGANDILLGDAIGRVSHFAGSEWATVDSGFNDVLGDMWGDPDGSVFFYSQGAFGRWHAGAVEKIYDHQPSMFPSHYFTDIWGNSSTEVFATLNDRDFDSYTCGATFVVWFDGQTFHQF
jgi:hypothetical protein